MNFQNPTFAPAVAASKRIRTIWKTFEQSQANDRAQLTKTIQAAVEKADVEWNKSSNVDRMSRSKHKATKLTLVKTIKSSYFDQARALWYQKLESLGLKADFWTDLTEDEIRRITYYLGADDESDDELPEFSQPPQQQQQQQQQQAPTVQPTQPSPFFQQPLAPSFSTSSRATNLSSSSYAFVNPSEFNSEDEDFEFEGSLSNPVATSADLTSEDDDDVGYSVPGYPATRPNLVGSGFSSHSSVSQTSLSNPSKQSRPLVSGFAYNAAPVAPTPTTAKRQVVSQNESKPVTAPTPAPAQAATTKARIPRQPYVGPSLDDTDEPINEEVEFEKFKMRTRIEKIVEFHEAAALAEISLSIEIYKARKQLNNSKEEDARSVLDHQQRMAQLQKEKEEERKAIVKSERARRQSDLGRRLATPADVKMTMKKKESNNNSAAFHTWDPSSFQEEMNIPSRFNLDTLLADDPANVDNLLSEMFAGGGGGGDYYQPQPHYAESPIPSLFNSYSSTSTSASAASNYPDGFRSSAAYHNYNNIQDDEEDEDEEENALFSPPPAKKSNQHNMGRGIADEPTPIWNTTKRSAPSPAPRSAWVSKDVGSTTTTPVNSAWSSSKKPTRQASTMNSFFDTDDMEPEPPATATPPQVTTSKAAAATATAKGKKASTVLDKSPVRLSPPIAETISKAETPAAVPPAPVPAPISAAEPTPAPAAPVSKKQNKKQRQGNKKGGGAAAAAPVAPVAEVIPEKEPEPEPVVTKREESPKLEAPIVASAVDQASLQGPEQQQQQHMSWMPKMTRTPAMARARSDSLSGPPQPPSSSFSWDEITSTPRPPSKIPAHLQESLLKSEGMTPRPTNMFLKKQQQQQNMMGEVFGATTSRITLDQQQQLQQQQMMMMMQQPTPVGKGPVWGSAVAPVACPTPGPSLWGKTKADFGAPAKAVVAPQPVASGSGSGGDDFWVPGGFDGVEDRYKAEGDGGGGGGGTSLWQSAMETSSHSAKQQTGKSASIPVKQVQRLRRVSEASSPAPPRTIGTKDLSDMSSQQQQQQPAASAASVSVSPTTPTSKKARGKKNNGKGKQRVTVEEVSDEEKDNIDILPQTDRFVIMEEKEKEEKVILEPRPSVPSSVYNSVIDFGDVGGAAAVDDDDDDFSSSFFTRPTGAAGATGSNSSLDDFFGGDVSSSSSTRYSNVFGGGSKPQQSGMNATATASAGIGGKHARWTPGGAAAVNSTREESSLASLLGGGPPPSRLQQQQQSKPVQQTPIWGQPNPSAKDKGKGKR